MYKLAKPFFTVIETPLHAGSGQDLGIVDMPIQRERHTGFPKIEGSGLKGSIREALEGLKEDNKVISDKLKKQFPDLDKKFDHAISLVFGPEKGDAHAGALGFTDARILLFPVKSMKGVFAYITCPKVLKRFKEDLELCNNSGAIKTHFFKDKDKSIKENTVSNIKELGINENVILEEYTLGVEEDENTKKFAKWLAEIVGINVIKDKLVVLSDDDFRDFVNLSTEVITRTKIDNEKGTVQQGALFTEEYLPAETVMYSLTLTTPIFNKDKGIFIAKDGKQEEELVMEFFENGIPEVIQIGGNATIGKGIVRVKVWEDNNG